jgi:ribonuclease HII
MVESVAQSSITSETSAEKLRASKKGAKAKPFTIRRALARGGASPLFGELARLAEMSSVERQLRAFGFQSIAGTDEVGRGCLAGPVVAASVILPVDCFFGVNDSKQLAEAERRDLCVMILSYALAVGIGVVDADTIDRINILRASKSAMRGAVEAMEVRPEILLLDAVLLEDLEMPQVPLIEGDRRSISIAAASIVAKVYRDSLMESYHDLYPQYDFIHNRGYGTESHQRALETHGPTPIHRRSFQGVHESLLLFET